MRIRTIVSVLGFLGAMVASLSGVPDYLPDGWKERMEKRSKLVAIVAYRGSQAQTGPRRQQFLMNPDGDVKSTGLLDESTAVVLTDRVSADRTLEWDVPPGDWQIFTFKQFPADLRVVGGAGAGPQLVMDHMNRDAFLAHAHRVGDSARQRIGDYFGSGLRAIFCDSLEVHAYLFWSDSFLAEFKQRRGYDLTPFLPILKVPGFSDPYGSFPSAPIYDIPGTGEKVRRDYWQTVSDVMVDNFYQPFTDWAKEHKLLARVQAHGAPADVARIYGLSNIPETEDLYDSGRYDFLKIAASAAHVYGHKIASSESFVWMGKAYQTTPEKIKRYADELLTAGINEIIYHGFPYEYMDRPEPGWHPFSSPLPFSSHMNAHNPFWPYIPRLNAYMTRLQYLSQEGTNVAPVALYRSKLSYDAIEPPPPEPQINTQLMAAGYNFDQINTEALERSHVENGELVTPGGAIYRVLILNDEPAIRVELAEKLAEFRNAKLPVVYIGNAPDREAGFRDSERKSQRIRELMKGVEVVPSVASAITALRVTPGLRFRGASVPYMEKRYGATEAFFLRNPDPEPKQMDVTFVASGAPESWDPWTGDIQPVDEFIRESQAVRIRFELDPYGSKLFVFDPSTEREPKPSSPKPSIASSAPITLGAKGWKLQAGTVNVQLSHLEDWAKRTDLKTFSGKGTYTTTFEVDRAWLRNGKALVLDLGQVGDVAEIRINARPGPALLLRPYRTNIKDLVKPGANTIEVVVTNTLFNDIAAREKNVNSFPGMPGLAATPQLMPSGLMGPVTLRVE